MKRETKPLMIVTVAIGLLCASCGREYEALSEPDDVIQVTQLTELEPKPYRGGVYIVVDRKTGKEYIGVSGLGLVERATGTTPDNPPAVEPNAQ